MCVTKGPLIKFHICSVRVTKLYVLYIVHVHCTSTWCIYGVWCSALVICAFSITKASQWCLWLCQHSFVVQSSSTQCYTYMNVHTSWLVWTDTEIGCCTQLHMMRFAILSHLWVFVLFFSLPRERERGGGVEKNWYASTSFFVL